MALFERYSSPFLAIISFVHFGSKGRESSTVQERSDRAIGDDPEDRLSSTFLTHFQSVAMGAFGRVKNTVLDGEADAFRIQRIPVVELHPGRSLNSQVVSLITFHSVTRWG